jgi:hypothetical protein
MRIVVVAVVLVGGGTTAGAQPDTEPVPYRQAAPLKAAPVMGPESVPKPDWYGYQIMLCGTAAAGLGLAQSWADLEDDTHIGLTIVSAQLGILVCGPLIHLINGRKHDKGRVLASGAIIGGTALVGLLAAVAALGSSKDENKEELIGTAFFGGIALGAVIDGLFSARKNPPSSEPRYSFLVVPSQSAPSLGLVGTF